MTTLCFEANGVTGANALPEPGTNSTINDTNAIPFILDVLLCYLLRSREVFLCDRSIFLKPSNCSVKLRHLDTPIIAAHIPRKTGVERLDEHWQILELNLIGHGRGTGKTTPIVLTTIPWGASSSESAMDMHSMTRLESE
jgi:hypothetical protein